MSEEIYNNEASQDEVSAELDAMVCDLIDDMLNSLADGEDLSLIHISRGIQRNAPADRDRSGYGHLFHSCWTGRP